MTENINVSAPVVQNQNQAAPTESVQSNSPAPQTASEKMLRQSEVNDLVGSAKHTSYEKGKQDALAEFQRQNQNQSVNATQPTNNNVGGQSLQLTPEQRAALAKELTPEIAASIQKEYQNQQLVHQFALKMTNGQQKYQDFEKVVTALNLPTITNVVQLANDFDNTADIMYDLGNNPSKVSNLTVLAQINPQLAYQEMQKLSDSIKKNETALANQPNVREPLSQIKSSNVGVGSGKLTSAERRKHPLYRV